MPYDEDRIDAIHFQDICQSDSILPSASHCSHLQISCKERDMHQKQRAKYTVDLVSIRLCHLSSKVRVIVIM